MASENIRFKAESERLMVPLLALAACLSLTKCRISSVVMVFTFRTAKNLSRFVKLVRALYRPLVCTGT